MLRRLALPALFVTAAAVPFVLPMEAQANEPKISSGLKGKIEKGVEKLFGENGKLLRSSGELAEAFLDLDKVLAGDKKGDAMRANDLWAGACHAARFTSGGLKSAQTKKVLVEEMAFADGKTVPLAVYGPNKYKVKERSPLLLFVLPKGEDPKEKLQSVVDGHDGLKSDVVLAAIAMTDDFSPESVPYFAALPLSWTRDMFNVDSDRWYVVAQGNDVAGPVQESIATLLADRVAGVALHGVTEAKISTNTGLYDTAVVATEGSDEVQKAYADLLGENAKTIAAGETELEELYQWVTTGPGRRVQSNFTWTTTIDEEGAGQGTFASFVLESPGKRGEATTATVAYDRDANTVTVDGENIGEVTIYMNDQLLDLDKAVTVSINGSEVANRVFKRSLRAAFNKANGRGEWGRFYMTSFRGFAPTTIEASAESEDGGEKKDGE